MTKSELAKKISNTTGVDYATSLSVVEAFMFEVKSALEKENLSISEASEVSF